MPSKLCGALEHRSKKQAVQPPASVAPDNGVWTRSVPQRAKPLRIVAGEIWNFKKARVYFIIRLTNLGFELASQEEVLDLFPIEHFLKKVWWSHIDERK